MTYQPDFTLPAELLEQIAFQGLDFIPELVRIVVNTAMQAERENHLGVEPYQRLNERQGLGKLIKKRHQVGQQMALRARIVLAAADGLKNKEIGAKYQVTADTIRLWRNR